MDNQKKQFKFLFSKVAQEHGFKAAFGGWYKESLECIVVLQLQKSNYGNYCDLNVKTYIQGVFNRRYVVNKNLVKNAIGHIFTRQPQAYNSTLDLDDLMSDETRKMNLENLFKEFIVPDTTKTLSRAGIQKLAAEGEFILPAIREELGL